MSAGLIGETIRKFEIQSELGAGGYGAVYRAHDVEVNRDVAIKVILPQYADDPDFKQRFESEARLVAQLESRQIVPLYDYWQDERGAFLVMRLIRGGSLRRIMSKQDALSLSQTLRVATDIAEALAIAHENNVVHRDLKPENILIDERGNAYLTDFGIAKRTTEAQNITEADAIIGTWAYLSPEQIQNHDVSPQTDIYAFGVLLYEMLAGQHPFHGTPATMMIMKHLQEPLPDISDSRPDLPHELDHIIEKATAKDPTERYDSALVMLDALKAAANQSGARAASLPVQTVTRRKPTSPEERNRQAMLQNVRKFWIEGVLENSVQDAILLNLGKSDASSQISNPWDTVVRTPNMRDEALAADASIVDVFEQMNGKLLILGEPGGGKTTMLLELARALLAQAEHDDAHPLPVVFNLSSWAESQPPLESWLVSELSSKYQVPRKVASNWVERDELLLLLDGLDEVKAEARDACVAAINAYRTEHGFVDMVVCSRIHDYEDLSDRLLLNGAIIIQPLTDKQIDDYLNILGTTADVPRQLLSRDAEMRDLARTPLMLNIIAQAYKDATSDDLPNTTSIEDSRHQVFARYVESTFKRRGKSAYTAHESAKYLHWLANAMQAQGTMIFQQINFTRDIIPEGRRIAADTVLFSTYIPIWSITTYFGVAWFFGTILGISQIGFAVIFIVAFTIWFIVEKIPRIQDTPLQDGIPAIVIALCVAGLSISSDISASLLVMNTVLIFIYAYVFYANAMIDIHYFNERETDRYAYKPVLQLTYNARVIRPIRVIYPTILAMVLASLMGLNFVEAGTLQFFLAVGAAGLVGALTGLLYAGLEVGSESIQQTERNILIESAKSGLIIGLCLFLTYIVPVLLAAIIFGVALTTSVTLAITSGLTAFVQTAATNGAGLILLSFITYGVIRVLGWLPRNTKHFLDYAVSLILLRKVGNGYIFIHRYLLEYFAELDVSDNA